MNGRRLLLALGLTASLVGVASAVPYPSASTPASADLGAARAVLESGATAVMTYNDLLAIGLMQELQAAGILVPDALSIVGFDDIFGADFTTPTLNLDEVIAPRSELPPLLEVKVTEIIDFLVETGQALSLERNAYSTGSVVSALSLSEAR